MNKGRLLGKGTTAEVYEWGEDKVIKLYYPRYGDAWISREVEIGLAVHAAGVSSPEVFGVVETEGRKGLLFQKISGKSMLWHTGLKPWEIHLFAQKMATFQFDMHQLPGEGLPSQKDRFTSAIRDSRAVLGYRLKRIREYLDNLPEGTRICHGDLHFDNILCTGRGLVAIDWTQAYQGNPLGDAARTCLMALSPTIPQDTPEIVVMPYRFAKQVTFLAYSNEYMRLAKVDYSSIRAWMLPVAAVRLREKVPGEMEWLMGIIDEQLKLT